MTDEQREAFDALMRIVDEVCLRAHSLPSQGMDQPADGARLSRDDRDRLLHAYCQVRGSGL